MTNDKIMQFKTKNTTLTFQHIQVDLTIIENLDELYDALIAKGNDHPDVKDERIPYWADLWASALAMSDYLVENQELISPSVKITEIGCGLGLPSIVAGKLGANEICLTDYDQDSLDFAKLNWMKNLPNKMADFQLLDWRNPDPSVAADLLLASDVAYESRAFEPLLNAFKTLLKPNGIILITEPNRPVSTAFFSNLHTEGYVVKKTQREIVHRGHEFLINVFECKKLAIH
ncbi:MAG: methyltransferase domain-containing protein [Saprospiraceae bacterium]|nr:methyltransferase domain-containing protein [Saprospiraceae bacterium]